MAWNISKQVWGLEMKPQQKLVLLLFAEHAHEDGNDAFPSLKRAAEMTGFHRNTVRKYIKQLIELGHLEVQEKRSGKPTIYRLTYTPQSVQPIDEPAQVDVQPTYTPQSVQPQIVPIQSGVHPPAHSRVDGGYTPQDVHEPLTNHQLNHIVPDGTPTQKTKFDYHAMKAAVEKVFEVRKKATNNYINMLRGTSKTGDWEKHNFDEPSNAEEVLRFGEWYKRKYGNITIVKKPSKIQSEFAIFRETKTKSRFETTPDGKLIYYPPTDTGPDFSETLRLMDA